MERGALSKVGLFHMSSEASFAPDLMRLRPRPQTHYVSCDRVVLATGPDGFVCDHGEQGLFVRETRFLCRYRYWIDNRPVRPVSLSNITQDRWLGYYLAGDTAKATPLNDAAQKALELKLSRQVLPNGFFEDVCITNFTGSHRRLRLTLELAADFAGLAEANGPHRQHGRKRVAWRNGGDDGELTFTYRARHRFSHQGKRGMRSMTCRSRIHFAPTGNTPVWREGKVHFTIALPPRANWACRIALSAEFEDAVESAIGSPGIHAQPVPEQETRFASPESDTLAPVVVKALNQGCRDLRALRLFDLDQADGGWVPAAGLPLYVALFGRDTLTAAWEAAPLTTNLMRGVLPVLARWQGKRTDNWRDEEPGKMLHEMHTGPLAILNYIPQGRDYGSVTTSAFYPFVLAQLWHWTGDKELVSKYLQPAADALKWLDRHSRKRRGFCWYQTRSSKGIRNQSWKDSGDAIVYEDGSQVDPPIATCEQQGIIYAAKMNFAEVLWWFGRKDEAKRHYREAVELKKRFNQAFWMPQEGFVALALDSKGRQVRSITSNPVHCVATGILDDAHIPAVLSRLFAPDMFSGWGVRTLSSDHPAFNPYAYHRGTVWPVEHGPFAVGAYRYGQHDYVERICRAQFELAALFDHAQLPECIAGHPRDGEHPFPALYPAANAPQAWSATTPFTLLQAMLGMQPFAPLKLLFIDPFLPAWLPEITLSGMRVGKAVISMRFYRKPNGSTAYKILDKRGTLRVLRQPSPWSFTATLSERAGDALASIFH